MEVDVLYWDIVTYLTDILEHCIEAYLYCRFIKPFLPEKSRIEYIWITYVIVSLFILFVPFEVTGTYAYAILSMTIFIGMYFLDKRNVGQKIFLAVTCYLLEWIAWGIDIAIWNVTYDISMVIPAMYGNYVLQFWTYVIREILWLIMFFVIMRLLVELVHKAYTYKKENMTKKELVLMLAPLASLIAGRVVFRFFNNVYEMDLKRYVWDNHQSYNMLLLLYQVISFASMLTVITIYQSIKGSQRREKEETVLARQLEDMEKHIGEVEKLYHDIRSLKHDMRNHVMVLENLCGENEEAGRYVTQLKAQIDESTLYSSVKSGNPITDIIIKEKQKEAEEKGIDFRHEFHYPENTKLNVFDVSVILNNAINNAMEAAAECEKPYIRLSSYYKGNAYMIEICNSCVGNRMINEDSGLPITTKEGGGHGFGLANIRKMSQKYHGDIDIEQSEGEFVLSIMLQL